MMTITFRYCRVRYNLIICIYINLILTLFGLIFRRIYIYIYIIIMYMFVIINFNRVLVVDKYSTVTRNKML